MLEMPSERVTALAATCIRKVVSIRLKQTISPREAMDLANAHRADVESAVKSLEQKVQLYGKNSGIRAITEAAISASGDSLSVADATVRLRQEAALASGYRSKIVEAERRKRLTIDETAVEIRNSSVAQNRLLDALEELYSRTKKRLRLLNLTQEEESRSDQELEEILAHAIESYYAISSSREKK